MKRTISFDLTRDKKEKLLSDTVMGKSDRATLDDSLLFIKEETVSTFRLPFKFFKG